MMVPIDIKDQLIRELIRACKKLGAKSDLLGLICSYGETLDDEFILEELRCWNLSAPIEGQRRPGGAIPEDREGRYS